jgi:hypothetical protein
LPAPILLTPAGGAPISVISARMFHFWRGAWIVDCELDPTQPTVTANPPTSGKASLSMAGQTMSGTIDQRGSGSFLTKASARLVGGGNGWDQPVTRQDFHSDTGVLSTTIYTNTAALIGETINDLVPQTFPILDFVRTSGPASRVFAGREYWLDLSGITNVGARPAGVVPSSLVVTDYDPTKAEVHFGADEILFPNTTLTDSRFNGATPVVRDVEQVFNREGGKGWAWIGATAATRLVSALENLAVEATSRQYLRGYQYRVAIYQGNRLALQAVNPNGVVPDIVPLTPWTGVSGISSTLTLGSLVFVTFDHTTEPPQPIAVSFGPGNAQSIALQGGGAAVARVGDTVTITQAELTAAGAVAGSSPVTITAPLQCKITSGSATVSSG